MASQAQADIDQSKPSAYVRFLLPESVRWDSNIDGAYDIERVLELNVTMSFERDGKKIRHCMVVSQGNEYLATFTADLDAKIVDVVVYRMASDSMDEIWKSQFAMQSSTYYGVMQRDYTTIHGYVSSDGERVLVEHKVDYGDFHFDVTSNRGAHWTTFRMKGATYYSHGDVSGDDEHIFFTRSGKAFGSGGQAEIVDAYSTRTWDHVKSWSFGFGDGRFLQNFKLLHRLAIDKPVFCTISTSTGSEIHNKCIIASSSQLQFHVDVDSYTGGRVFISDDDHHMIYLTRDDGIMCYWDLTKPSLRPLKSIVLPDIEIAPKYIHKINGQDTVIRNAIPKQITFCRFSPGAEVVTIVVANDCSIVVSSFLTFNLQLVYKKIVNYSLWPGYVVLKVHIGPSRGVTVVGAIPHRVDGRGIFGLIVTFVAIPGAYEEIRTVEQYFDTVKKSIKTIDVRAKDEGGELHRWRASLGSVVREVGYDSPMTIIERESQRTLFDSIFLRRSSQDQYSLQEIQAQVVHFLTISYPWDSTSKVFVFAVRMKYDYCIMAMSAVTQTSSEPYLLRVLYTSENLYSDKVEKVQIFKSGPHYVLRVTSESGGAYSGIPLPTSRTTIIGHHFVPSDADYDLFIIKESTSVTMPNGFISTPNVALTFSASFAAYFPPGYLRCGELLDVGHRNRSQHIVAKVLMWLSYTHRSRRNEPFFGGGELIKELSKTYAMVYDDPVYDDRQPVFPSAFATAANIDILSNQIVLVDEFLRRYHQSNDLIISNSRSISCSLPVACRARAIGVLSFMRHIALQKFHIPDIGAIESSNKAHETKSAWRLLIPIRSLFNYLLNGQKGPVGAGATTITIPLEAFSSYECQIHKSPSTFFFEDGPSSVFYALASYAYYENRDGQELQMRLRLRHSGRTSGPTSPFSCLVEEVFDLKDAELQFAFVKVIWFEKLVFWKIEKFGKFVYLSRIVLPLLANLMLHLALSIITAGGRKPISALVLGGVQALNCIYLAVQKGRQASGTRLFYRSIFNYIDIAVIPLSATMSAMVLSRNSLPRTFIAYSIPVLWIDLILTTRVFEPAGVLMILLTEMTKGVLPFLGLLASFIVGFTFVPFFLLQSEHSDDPANNPFQNFGQSIGEMIAFMANDFSSLDPWIGSLVSIRILRSIFTVIISILLLNCLIALLNLKVEEANRRSRNIWARQMAALLVEIERGLLTNFERKNPNWFPRWFTYTITEFEKQEWQDFVEKHPLKLDYGPDGDDREKRPNRSSPAMQTSTSAQQSPSPTPSTTPQSASDSKPPLQPQAQSSTSPATLDQSQVTTPSVQMVSSPENPSHATFAKSPSTPSSTVEQSKQSATQQSSSASGSQPHELTIAQLTNSPTVQSSSVDSRPQTTEVSAQTTSVPTKASENLTTATEESTKCQLCDLNGTKICTGCRKVRYCSIEHQNWDWKDHKKQCKGKSKVVFENGV